MSEPSPAAGASTSTGASENPRPRFSDTTKALSTQVVRLSGTVSWTSDETESLRKQKPLRACPHPSFTLSSIQASPRVDVHPDPRLWEASLQLLVFLHRPSFIVVEGNPLLCSEDGHRSVFSPAGPRWDMKVCSEASPRRRCSGTCNMASVMATRPHACTDFTAHVQKRASDKERKDGRSRSHLEDGVGISHLEAGLSVEGGELVHHLQNLRQQHGRYGSSHC